MAHWLTKRARITLKAEFMFINEYCEYYCSRLAVTSFFMTNKPYNKKTTLATFTQQQDCKTQ